MTATDDLFNSATGTFTVTVVRKLTALGDAEVWVGLKNSDDAGLRLDLRADVLVSGALVGQGQVDNVAAFTPGSAPSDINRLARQRQVTVFLNLLPTASQATVQAAIQDEFTALNGGSDYVGRFIWTPSTDRALAGPKFGVAVAGADGRVAAERAGERSEFCLGAGAHTHYFANDAAALALEIERLVAGAAAN